MGPGPGAWPGWGSSHPARNCGQGRAALLALVPPPPAGLSQGAGGVAAAAGARGQACPAYLRCGCRSGCPPSLRARRPRTRCPSASAMPMLRWQRRRGGAGVRAGEGEGSAGEAGEEGVRSPPPRPAPPRRALAPLHRGPRLLSPARVESRLRPPLGAQYDPRRQISPDLRPQPRSPWPLSAPHRGARAAVLARGRNRGARVPPGRGAGRWREELGGESSPSPHPALEGAGERKVPTRNAVPAAPWSWGVWTLPHPGTRFPSPWDLP